ncbi:TetR family transcriptional regulator [Streptomyces sp. V4-01]|uniref:TetR family transcriptional regulator n=1 Tax=Actinacidiphila polyblastidii TaxID=3110430 RepID=A0ABU7PB37_9ACTN|nr:TetR family transcriptional regulator [Streptomyces sp. V4-01]
MARPREFDTDRAVERAMDLFWRQGFAATSLQDLTAELGIGSGSLYAAFGSKEGLYERALAAYCTGQAGELVRNLEEAQEVRPALRSLLTGLMEADLAAPERGCLLVNSATERAGHPATVARVSATMRRVESALTEALVRARARGELASDKEPAALARFFTTFIQGLRVMGQARADRAFTEDAIDTALRALD